MLLELEGVRMADGGEGYRPELGKVKRMLEAEGLIHDCLICAIVASQVPRPTCFWKWVGAPVCLYRGNFTLRHSSGEICA